MKTTILSSFDSIPYFSLEAVKQLLGEEPGSPGTIRTALYRWMKAGQVYRLKKGIYMTRRFYENHRADMDFAPAVSSILIPQSYVSLEYVLQRHGLLTEVTYPISAITIKQTRVIESILGTYIYRNIKEDLYYGFDVKNYFGIPFSQASAAKALFDFLYLRPWKNKGRYTDYDLAEDLRMNLDEFSEADRIEFEKYIESSESQKMDQILKNLRKTVWRR